jgi:hypothetical protein
MKKIDKFYDTFTPDERVKLALAAMGRNDEAELRRLWDTCPRKNYRMQDAAFDDRMDAVLLIAKSVLSYLLLIEKDIRMARLNKEWYKQYVTGRIEAFRNGMNLGWQKAGKKGVACTDKIPADVDRELPEELQELHNKAVSELKGYYAALETFCAEIGIEVDLIISLDPIIKDAYDRLSPYLNEDTPADQEVMSTMYNAFHENLPHFNSGMTA